MLKVVPLGRAVIVPKSTVELALITFLHQRRMCLSPTAYVIIHLCYARGNHLFPQLRFNLMVSKHLNIKANSWHAH